MDQPKPSIRPFKKHVFVCTGPRCAPETSPGLYGYLKTKLKDLKLSEGEQRIHRSQCHCFGICKGGPLAVVYPDNVWYSDLTQPKLDRIIEEHLVGGNPVEEFVFHKQEQRVS